MNTLQELEQTIIDMVDDQRGILAADESTPTIKKRFDSIGVESTEESRRANPEEVAEETMKVFKRTVPVAVPSINFLSGGQSPEEATENLNAINQMKGNALWQLSISYGRALQQPALQAWDGKTENREACQQALLKRARFNSLAHLGHYSLSEE